MSGESTPPRVSRGSKVGWAVLVLSWVVSGCATTDCDPGRGGFVRGVGCSMSDQGYEKRQQQKSAELSQEQMREAQLQATYQQTQAEQKRVRAQRDARERQYREMQNDLGAMRRELAVAAVENRALEQQIADLEGEIRLLQQDEFAPDQQKTQRLEQLQKRKQLLQREVDAVLDQ